MISYFVTEGFKSGKTFFSIIVGVSRGKMAEGINVSSGRSAIFPISSIIATSPFMPLIAWIIEFSAILA